MIIAKTYDKQVAIEKMVGAKVSVLEEIALGGIAYRIETAYHGTYVCETFCGKDGNYYTKVWELLD